MFIIHSSSHTCGRCYFSNRFCPFQPIRFKHSPLFQALYRIIHHSLSAAVLPCGGCSVRVRARAKKSPSRSVPLEGAARLVETPVGESERRQSKLVLSAALSFTCGVALARQSSNVQACHHYEWWEFHWRGNQNVPETRGSKVQKPKPIGQVRVRAYN